MFSTTHQVTLETSNPITSSKHVHNHDNHEPIQLDEVVSAWRQWQFATLGYYPPKTYAPTPIAILYIKVTMSVCLSVCPCGQCLEFFSRHCPFPVECLGGGGGGRESPVKHGAGGPARAGGGGGGRAGQHPARGGHHKRGKTGRGGAQRVHYAPGSH
jgi:hypothetical protein